MLKGLLTGLRAGAGSRDPSRRGESGGSPWNLGGMPADVVEVIIQHLDARDVVALTRVNRHLRVVATLPQVWSGLLHRSFAPEELPLDVDVVISENSTTAEIRAQFRQLKLQRPAFISDAPRTSEVIEYSGSRFRKVLHLDGRRDLNFSTVFRDIPPGQYCVVWRVQLQPGFTRGYCNFRAVFSRLTDSRAMDKPKTAASRKVAVGRRLVVQQLQRASGGCTGRGRRVAAMLAGEEDGEEVLEAAAGRAGLRWQLQQGLKRLLPSGCVAAAAVGEASVHDGIHGMEAEAVAPVGAPVEVGGVAAGVDGGAVAAAPHQLGGQLEVQQPHPEIEVQPDQLQPPPQVAPQHQQLQRAMGQPNGASVKRDAAYGAGTNAPRYVHKWLTPLWGGHSCSWRQLDPSGPLGNGVWRTLQMGSLTVRRAADVHLHSVMVQLRAIGVEALQAAMPPGETRWRGALVDYVELVPVRESGLLEGMLPDFMTTTRASFVSSEMPEGVVVVPTL